MIASRLISTKKHLAAVVAATTIGGAVAGFALFGSEGMAQPQREPADFSLTSDTSPSDAVRKASADSGVNALLPRSELPAGLNLWIAAAEYGPEGKRSSYGLNSVVLDYYQGRAPEKGADLIVYRGLRLQIVFRQADASAPPNSKQLSGFAGSAQLFKYDPQAADDETQAYLLSGDGRSIEVRLWSTADGRLPDADELTALLKELAGWLE